MFEESNSGENILKIIDCMQNKNYESILATQAIIALPSINTSIHTQKHSTNLTKDWNLINQSLCKLENSNLSSYLAGLIESDGSIVVPAENIKSYKPFFELVFHSDDLALAEILQSIIGGNLYLKKNYCRLIIKKKKRL